MGVSLQANRGRALEELVRFVATAGGGSSLVLTYQPALWRPVRENGVVVDAFPVAGEVNFTGVYIGLPIAFDAKEVVGRFPWRRVSEAQGRFLERFEAAGGFSFLLLGWMRKGELVILPCRRWIPLWRGEGRRSLRLEEARRIGHSLPVAKALAPLYDALWKAVWHAARDR